MEGGYIMTAPQEAINELMKLMDTAECKDALKAGIEALEKQIPKVIAPYAGEEYDEDCPVTHDIWCANCGSIIEDDTWIYCPYCGQKIDWDNAG